METHHSPLYLTVVVVVVVVVLREMGQSVRRKEGSVALERPFFVAAVVQSSVISLKGRRRFYVHYLSSLPSLLPSKGSTVNGMTGLIGTANQRMMETIGGTFGVRDCGDMARSTPGVCADLVFFFVFPNKRTNTTNTKQPTIISLVTS